MALAVVAIVTGALFTIRALSDSGDSGTQPLPDISLDAWAPYWVLDNSTPELSDRIDSIREISPFWFTVSGARSIDVDPNAPDDLIEEFMAVARDSDAALVPSVVDGLPAGEMAAILANPRRRTRHVDTLVDFATEGDFDGLDIDYEQFAFADGRDTWADTRPNWVAFVEELGTRLHKEGLTLTVSIPPVYDDEQTNLSGFWVYDYGAIVDHVDRIRIMAYDFSVNEPGPIAPIAWVDRAILGALDATGSPEKLVLGVPSYGRNWPLDTQGECDSDELPGQTSVTARTVDDLIERRDAIPEYIEDTAEYVFEYPLQDPESNCVQNRIVHYVDGDGIRLRMDLAREHHLSGVSLWALGFDDDAVWDAILPTVSDPSAPVSTPGLGGL